MARSVRRNAVASSRVCPIVVLASLLLAPKAYRIVDLGLPPGVKTVEAVALNNRGEVLAKTNERGYLWRGGRWIDLGEPTTSAGSGDPARVRPEALNDFAVVVGGQGSLGPVFMSGLEFSEAFIWRGRGIEDLKAGSTTSARAINNLGDVVGGDGQQAFARLRGKIVALPQASNVEPRDPSGEMGDVNRAYAIAINDRRQILMNSTYGGKHGDANLPSRPFLVDGNARRLKLRALPLPKGFHNGRGVALNARGTVLAVASYDDRRGEVPYLVSHGRITLLPFARDREFVGALNSRDEVVGNAISGRDIGYRNSRPLLWRAGRLMPLPAFEGWTLVTVDGINDKGMICGKGSYYGKTRAFLLLTSATR